MGKFLYFATFVNPNLGLTKLFNTPLHDNIVNNTPAETDVFSYPWSVHNHFNKVFLIMRYDRRIVKTKYYNILIRLKLISDCHKLSNFKLCKKEDILI